MDSLWTARNITPIDGSSYEAIDSSISQETFSCLKMFNMKCRKNIRAEDDKERMNIVNFINMYMYTNIYIYIYIYIYFYNVYIYNIYKYMDR